MRAILFDCDGTLADSFGMICAVMEATFTAAGLPAPDDAATRKVIGLSLDKAILKLHPLASAAEIERLAGGYREAFRAAREAPESREQLFSGMRELIEQLSEREDVLLGLVTGKSRRGVAALLAAQKLEPAFAAIRTADDCPSKPHPAMVQECCAALGLEPHATAVVGDSVYDMEMACSAGARGVGVAWGSASPAELTAAGAHDVARDVDALRAILFSFVGSETAEAAAS